MIRRQIKERIRDFLKDETRAGENVFIGQSAPTDINTLPVILIYSPTEATTRYNEAPKTYVKTLVVSIECIDSGKTDDDLDYNLEELHDKVIGVLERDEQLGCLVDSIEQGSVEMQTESDGQSPSGAIVSNWSVFYIDDAVRGDDDCLDNFKGVNADWKVGDEENLDPDNKPVIDAQDEIDVDQ